MIDVKSKSRVKIHWKTSPYDYSKDKLDSLVAKASKKYGIPKDRVKVVPDFLVNDGGTEDVSVASGIIQNIQDPQFQLKLFKDYLDLNGISGYDFDIIREIDSEINAHIDYQVYDKYKRYSVKWIRWDNFMSYGEGNYFDFTSINGLALLSGEPANQSGKTTFAIDLLHFLLFGSTNRNKTQEKLFNKHLPEATSVVVEGCINIDGCDFVIKRTLSRPSLDKRTSKSKTVQKVEYYKIVGDDVQELDDYIGNKQEETTAKTNKAIKEAIGKESDFDLIMSVTESTLDELIDKKEAERGRLLSRWIGLLPLEEKDSLARERFNSEIKPNLVSNQFNCETLSQEIDAYSISIKSLSDENKRISKENESLEKELSNLESVKSSLLSSKQKIDESLLKIDITTLDRKIEANVSEGKGKTAEIALINDEIGKIGDISFSVEEYDKIQEALSSSLRKKAVIGEKYKSVQSDISKLRKGEVCPTCGRKLENIDNSAKISELEKQLEKMKQDGLRERKKADELSLKIEALRTSRELYTKKTQLMMKKSALEVNVERLRNEYKENISLKREYEKNSETISKNNNIDIKIKNTEIFIKDKSATIKNNLSIIASNESDIKNYKEQISTRTKIIKKLKEEEIIVKNWKIYMELVGKNGISKMVLRKALPVINLKLKQLLSDVCDFDVEVGINLKNEVMFYLVKDGVYSDLYSGSGFEKTASALALRSVLADMSTIPRCDIIVMDEVWGRVSKENFDPMRSLMEKISSSYNTVLLISHIDEINDWCTSHIIVKKENNISKIFSA